MENKKGSIIRRYFAALSSGDKKTYWASFAVLFLVMFLCMNASLIVTGKSFLWRDDGLTQQYTSFVMLGEWYRDLFNNFFVERNLIVPMWTEIVGYGEDVILSISSYIGNPFFVTAAFADAHNADFFIDLSVFLTMLASGITFTMFAKYRWTDGFAVLVGCMVYVFSGFSIIVFSQIHMVYSLTLAPLVFLGADKIFDGKKPFLFVVSLSLMLLYSLSTGYMCCLLLVVFCVVRFFTLENRTFRRFMKYLAIFLGCIALSVVISAVLFIPSAESLLSQERIGLERETSLLYSLRYYISQIYEGFFKYEYAGSECFIGFFPIALISLIYLFTSKKGRTKTFLIASFCILTAFLLIPFFGSVFNGFAYPNNRWIWGYSLLMGAITTYSLQQLNSENARIKKCFVVTVLAYAAIAALYMVAPGSRTFAFAVIVMMILFSILVLQGGRSVAWKAVVSCSLVVCCAFIFTMWLFPGLGGVATLHVDAGKAYDEAVTDSTNSLVLDIPGDDWRYDLVGSATTWRNTGVATGKNSVSFYNSMYNSPIDEYHSTLGLTTSPFSISFESMDSRPVMEQMAGVKYIGVKDGEDALVPSLYSEKTTSKLIGKNQYSLYESDHVLPLALVYGADSASSESSLDRMNAVEAQDAMLDGVLLDDESLPSVEAPSEMCYEAEYNAEMVQNAPKQKDETSAPVQPTTYEESQVRSFVEGGEIQVKDGGSTATFNANIPAGKRAYLCLKGLNYKPATLLQNLPDSQRDDLGTFGRIKLELKQLLSSDSSGCTITASAEDAAKGVWQPSSNAHLYGGKDSWAFNLGISDKDRSWVALTLNTPGFYSIDDIEVVIEDEQAVNENLIKLEGQGADNISFEWNTLTCDATAESDGDILFFRLPYSNGWHVKIDGKDAHLAKANIGFMATSLAKGDHHIELSYETPGLGTGAIMSAAGIAVIAVWAIVTRIRKSPKGRPGA